MAETSELDEEGLRKRNLIVRNLQEVLGEEKLSKQLAAGKNVHVYWGSATTGRPHVGYMVPMQKIADFLQAGLRVTILFADLHAFLDNMKSTWELLENRVLYYERTIKSLLTALEVPLEKLHFVKGATHQLTEAYTTDLLKLCGLVTAREAIRAGAQVVKQMDDPLLSGLLYPLLQALDEQYLKVDGQFGGVDQRKIFILAEEQLPKLKLGKRWHLMNFMVPGLTGAKMSSSEEDSKIDLLDPPAVVSAKIDSALCPTKSTSAENGILAFFKYVVFPTSQHSDKAAAVVIDGKEFSDYASIEEEFLKKNGCLSESSLKTYLKDFLNQVLEKVQQLCNDDEMEEIIRNAYPKTLPDGASMVPQVPLVEEVVLGLKCTGPKKVLDLLKGVGGSSGQPVKVMWRCAIKGSVNIAHFYALLKLREFAKLGCSCSILISDVEAHLDSGKCPWEAFEGRTKYYEAVLREFCSLLEIADVEILRSGDYQFNRNYVLEMYKIASKMTMSDSSMLGGTTLGSHLCPVYFTLDFVANRPDVLLLGEDRISFAQLAQKVCGKLNHPVFATAVLPQLRGMEGTEVNVRMSSSRPEFHLDPFDTPKQMRQKIAKSFCASGNVDHNVALELVEKVILPHRRAKGELLIERSEENGGDLSVKDFNDLKTLFESTALHPADLKAMVTRELNGIFEPIREKFPEKVRKEMLAAAFPPAKKSGTKKRE